MKRRKRIIAWAPPVWLPAVVWAVLAQAAAGSSMTIELSSGYAYALDVRRISPAAGQPAYPYVAFSGLSYVLRRFDSRSQWDWDARTGLLRLAVAGQRFSLSSAQAFVAVNDQRVTVASPVRFLGGEIWIPVETCRLVVGSIEGLQVLVSEETIPPESAPTSAPIVGSPEDALRGSVLKDPAGHDVAEYASSAPLLAIPPPDVPTVWRVVFDPVLIGPSGGAGEIPPSIRASLAQIAERCASLLRDEGSMQPRVLTEHSEATSPDLVLAQLSREPADLIVFLRVEISPLRGAPGYLVLYADESVDSIDLVEAADDAEPAAGTAVPLARRYRPFQTGNRRLAETIGATLDANDLPDLRERLVLPAPLYLLKRCPARSAMIVFSFPEGSPELARLGASDFRETVASALAGALIAVSRSYRGAGASDENTAGEVFR